MWQISTKLLVLSKFQNHGPKNANLTKSNSSRRSNPQRQKVTQHKPIPSKYLFYYKGLNLNRMHAVTKEISNSSRYSIKQFDFC